MGFGGVGGVEVDKVPGGQMGGEGGGERGMSEDDISNEGRYRTNMFFVQDGGIFIVTKGDIVSLRAFPIQSSEPRLVHEE